METMLLIFVGILVLYVAYLQLRLSATPPQTIVVMPSTTEQGSGLGCAAIALVILLAVIILAVLGVLPTIG